MNYNDIMETDKNTASISGEMFYASGLINLGSFVLGGDEGDWEVDALD